MFLRLLVNHPALHPLYLPSFQSSNQELSLPQAGYSIFHFHFCVVIFRIRKIHVANLR